MLAALVPMMLLLLLPSTLVPAAIAFRYDANWPLAVTGRRQSAPNPAALR